MHKRYAHKTMSHKPTMYNVLTICEKLNYLRISRTRTKCKARNMNTFSVSSSSPLWQNSLFWANNLREHLSQLPYRVWFTLHP